MEEKKNTAENSRPESITPQEAAAEAVNAQKERIAAENQRKNSLTDALIREVYALRESVERLKENNDMLSQLVSVNLSGTSEEKLHKDAFTEKLIRENEAYKKLAVQRIKDIIFNKVKEEYPDIEFNSFEEFPEDFHRLVCAKVSPGTAYRVTVGKTDSKKPKSMGKVNENSESQRDFYTSKEVDKLTKKQLSNPKIMETVMKSMLRW